MDLTTEDRIKLAIQLIEQAPPGEVKYALSSSPNADISDVIQDIVTIIGDHESLTPHVASALRTYNLEQLATVQHSDEDGSSRVVSKKYPRWS
jgi:hypothetical protein